MHPVDAWFPLRFQVCSELVRPLLVMSRLLQTQVDQLGALLARKDAQIQDYRETGATLSRGTHAHIRTRARAHVCLYRLGVGIATPNHD